MPRTLEALLWCSALATWLMLLFVVMEKRVKSLTRTVSRMVAEVFRIKTN